MSSPILLPSLLPLPPSPLPPLHSSIVLPRSIEDLLMLSMVLLFVLLLVIAILCGRRFAKSDEEELSKNLDIQASVFHYGVDGDDEQECAICLCEIEEGEKCRKMKTCGHAFHKDCIDRWFTVELHCPLCRTSVCVVVDRSENAMAFSSSFPTLLN
ncbi:hypothetical protein IC582_027708 [Cucumis melo]|uniref:RING-H2 finger protein ATL64-like n=1 Tax=Cucumis melo var. makuwa TaxID=1194695 RepID=A0A5A7VRG5_CUCMM|nr:RING-H2 finger protein ATL64-like [Cucumis melo var. makuwa]